MMIQPFLPSIASEGEYALILFDGVYSHTVVKRPKSGDFRVQPHLGGSTEPSEPPEGGDRACASGAGGCARRTRPTPALTSSAGTTGRSGSWSWSLIEPALFLDVAPHGEEAFANAVIAAAEQVRARPPSRRAS